MTIGEVAAELGLHRDTALKHVRAGKIPGGELLYTLDDGRERWTVDRAVFTEWHSAKSAKSANTAKSANLAT
jgi:excisionase family DNA binding protein